jgi:hypothetical protein
MSPLVKQKMTSAGSRAMICKIAIMTKRKLQASAEIEAELLRLNALVRERREQLARLEKCPNPECPCRVVWRNHVEKNLAQQVGVIRREVRSKSSAGKAARPRKR